MDDVDIDKKTFEVLESEMCTLNSYAKDKYHVFLGGKVLSFDSDTFEILGKYAKDKSAVYWVGVYVPQLPTSLKIKRIDQVDTESFVQLYSGDMCSKYAKDKNNVYEKGEIIEEYDASSFFVFNDSRYTKDKTSVYFLDKKIVVDLETFEILEGKPYSKFVIFSKDITNVYWQGGIIEGADPETFEVVGGRYAKDKNYVYSDYNIKKEIDPTNCTAENLDGCEGN